MLILEIIRVSLAAIHANKMRSFLTTLGIIIGVAAVITMVALGEGAQQQVQEQIKRMGTTVLTIRPGQQQFGGVRFGGDGAGARLSLDDAEMLRSDLAGVARVAPEAQSRMQLTYLRWNSNNQIMGTFKGLSMHK